MTEFWHILFSWPHWAFEVISDLVFAVPAYFLGRRGLRHHDKHEHGAWDEDADEPVPFVPTSLDNPPPYAPY